MASLDPAKFITKNVITIFMHLCTFPNKEHHTGIAKDSRFFEPTFPDASVSWLDSQCFSDVSPAPLRALWLHPVIGLNSGKPTYMSTIHITLTCFALVIEFSIFLFSLILFLSSFINAVTCFSLSRSCICCIFSRLVKNFTSWFSLFGRKTTWWIRLNKEFANGSSTGQRMWSKYRLVQVARFWSRACKRGSQGNWTSIRGWYASLPFGCRVNRYTPPI